MCTYNVVIEDQLAQKTEKILNGLPIEAWIKQQVEALASLADSSKMPSKRIAKIKKRAENSPTDEQLEAYFAGKPMPAIPEDPLWRDVIHSNSGRTIQSIEKWL